MSLALLWSDTSFSDIRDAGHGAAQSVCTAVAAFAADGSGDIEPVEASGYGAGVWRINTPSGFALVRVDEGATTLHVLRISAHNPPPRVIPLLDEPIHDEESGE